MTKTVNLIGIGEIGGVFARGLLKLGHPVYPVTRKIKISDAYTDYPDAQCTIVAVGETDLDATLAALPSGWRNQVCLLQNELLPDAWREHDISRPTVISVWFEKKPGQDPKVLLPSPVYGTHAALISAALEQVDIPTRVIEDENELLYELVRKNVYILTANICGLVTGGTVSELWTNHQQLARDIAGEVIAIQAYLTHSTPDAPRLLDGMLEAFEGDPEHKCMGRTAPARLIRAIAHAEQAGVPVPHMRAIKEKL